MKTIKIEKGVPIPEKQPYRAILMRMESGDSFQTDINDRAKISQIIVTIHKDTDRKYYSSSKGQPKGLVRIWRLV